MAQLPIPGGDEGTWGNILNGFLEVAHNTDGSLQTSAIQSAGAVTSVNGTSPQNGSLTLASSNLSDISLATPTANQVLAYNASTSKWMNATLTESDVTNLTTDLSTKVQLGGDLGGTTAAPTISKLQGTGLNAASPANNQVLSYSSSANQWVPATVTSTTVSDATSSAPGIIQLDGDLGGSATSPSVSRINGITLPSTGPTGSGQILTSTSTSATAWQTPTASLSNPMTTEGDLIVGGASGAAQRLAAGTAGYVLTTDGTSGAPSWQPGAGFINVLAYGADPTGSSASDTAFTNAIAACPANGGFIVVPPGTYKISTGITWVLGATEYSTLWLMPGAVLNYYGSGDCIRAYGTYNTDPDIDELQSGLHIMGYGMIDGTNASAGASGLHIGDMFRVRIDDIWIRNFTGTGSKGLWCDNENYWSEQWKVRAFLQWNATAAQLDTNGASKAAGYNSFDRSFFDFGIDQGDWAYDGVVINNGTIILEGGLTISGNFGSSATAPTSAVLRLNGTDGAGDYSSIISSLLQIGVESDTTYTYSPYTIVFGMANGTVPTQTGDPYVISNCYGAIQFGYYGDAYQTGNGFQLSNGAAQFENYAGPVSGDPGLQSGIQQNGITTLVDSSTTLTTTPTAITNLGVNVNAYQAYDVRIRIPYTSSAASGSASFALSTPGNLAGALLAMKVSSAAASATLTNSTTYAGVLTVPIADGTDTPVTVVNALTNINGTRILTIEGVICPTLSGELAVMASISGSSTVTITPGATMVITPVEDP